MGFEDDPRMDDPHYECANEIHRLEEENAALRAECEAANARRIPNLDAMSLSEVKEAYYNFSRLYRYAEGLILGHQQAITNREYEMLRSTWAKFRGE